jgi:hypothetical protein
MTDQKACPLSKERLAQIKAKKRRKVRSVTIKAVCAACGQRVRWVVMERKPIRVGGVAAPS